MRGIELLGADRTRQAAPNRVECVRVVRRCELGVLPKPFVCLFVVTNFVVELEAQVTIKMKASPEFKSKLDCFRGRNFPKISDPNFLNFDTEMN